MNAKIIDGKAVAQRIRSECAERVRLLKDRNGIAPGLAVVLVGDDPASRVYVNNKIKACPRHKHLILRNSEGLISNSLLSLSVGVRATLMR